MKGILKPAFSQWIVGCLVLGLSLGATAGIALRDVVSSPESIVAFAVLLIAFFDTLALGRVASLRGDHDAEDRKWDGDQIPSERLTSTKGAATNEARRKTARELVSLLAKARKDGGVPYPATLELVARLNATASAFDSEYPLPPKLAKPWFLLPFVLSTTVVMGLSAGLLFDAERETSKGPHQHQHHDYHGSESDGTKKPSTSTSTTTSTRPTTDTSTTAAP